MGIHCIGNSGDVERRRNYNQGFRNPVYIEGIQGFFTKDRDEFFRLWPRWPTKFQASAPVSTPTVFSFTIPGPFLSQEVVIGGVDAFGNAISINDDGNGGLWMQSPNPQVSVPTYGAVYPPGSPQAGFPIPGMYNLNTDNPGLNLRTNIGSVNYVTGAMSFTLPQPLKAGTTLTVFVSQYQTGRPYSLLFWNNVITIRPVPKLIHKIEVEVYLTPVQFMMTTDSPIMNQWVKYLAYASAVEILRQRQDMEGVENLMEGFRRQEGLVLERQAVEEINSRNQTVFASSQGYAAGNYGWNQGWWGG